MTDRLVAVNDADIVSSSDTDNVDLNWYVSVTVDTTRDERDREMFTVIVFENCDVADAD